MLSILKLISIALLMPLMGCASQVSSPDLGALYNQLAQHEDPYRNPIIVIPGLTGSRLVDNATGRVAWGAFGSGQIDPNTPTGARTVALPIEPENVPMADLRDSIRSDGALDRVVFNLLGLPINLTAYANILNALGVGGYRDQSLAEVIDYGDAHFTCFQFDYDWRRDIAETAADLQRFILEKQAYVRQETERRFGIMDYTPRFNIVAHSMGGLVARYYLRYGTADLPVDGSLPPITWAGAPLVENLVLIGTPNGGSLDSLKNLVNGYRPGPLFPRYSPAVIGTMPAVYQLLPRSRHRPIVTRDGQPVADIFDADLWVRQGWGLADPKQARQLAWLLPDIVDPRERRRVALMYQKQALARARQFTSAMDQAAKPPTGTTLMLVAGDAEVTPRRYRMTADGGLALDASGPGDGVVLRSSALLDERPSQGPPGPLESPIHWDQVLFIFADHIGLTETPMFTDNILFYLLERPRPKVSARGRQRIEKRSDHRGSAVVADGSMMKRALSVVPSVSIVGR